MTKKRNQSKGMVLGITQSNKNNSMKKEISLSVIKDDVGCHYEAQFENEEVQCSDTPEGAIRKTGIGFGSDEVVNAIVKRLGFDFVDRRTTGIHKGPDQSRGFCTIDDSLKKIIHEEYEKRATGFFVNHTSWNPFENISKAVSQCVMNAKTIVDARRRMERSQDENEIVKAMESIVNLEAKKPLNELPDISYEKHIQKKVYGGGFTRSKKIKQGKFCHWFHDDPRKAVIRTKKGKFIVVQHDKIKFI